jgi:GTP cyclohydrolase IA
MRPTNDPTERLNDSGKLAAEFILKHIGENPKRAGLIETPQRFSKALVELCSGYKKTLPEVVGSGIFVAEGSGLVAVQKIEFFSLCEHHLLPFWGHASIAYYPNKSILGLSKIARVVDLYARRLQVQERLTREIAEGINQAIDPRAVAVRIEAAHTCMMMRGVRKQNSLTTTEFFENVAALSSIESERLFQALCVN